MHRYDAVGMLRMARNYRRAGVKGKAKEHAERVIAEFPGTSYARQARALLAEMEQ